MSPILYWTLARAGLRLRLAARAASMSGSSLASASLANICHDHRQFAAQPDRTRMSRDGRLLVDLAVLVALRSIALQSDRFWPLWVAGLQLTTSVAHFLKAIDPDLIPQAYGRGAPLLELSDPRHPGRGRLAKPSANAQPSGARAPHLDERLRARARARMGPHVAAQEIASEPRHAEPAAFLGQACGCRGARQSRTARSCGRGRRATPRPS